MNINNSNTISINIAPSIKLVLVDILFDIEVKVITYYPYSLVGNVYIFGGKYLDQHFAF